MKVVINKKTLFWIALAALVVLGIVLGLVFGLQSSSQTYIVGAVVSNGRGCADIGSQMLDNGGSAVDSAIATLLCEGVILTHSMGIGGGFVATVYTRSSQKVETVIAREAAPGRSTRDMFVGEEEITGAKAGGVPGELLGYWEMHQKYGRLPWRELFQPTIKLCKEGHWVSKYLAAALKSKESIIRNEPSMAEIFVNPENDQLYKEGEYMKREVLGKTLEVIAEKGVKEMYDGGEIGRMFAEDIQSMNGLITEQDLKDYRVRWESDNHVMAKFHNGYTLYTTPLPSSGALLSFIMNVMDRLYTSDYDVYWQRVVETFKHAYGERTKLGDIQNEPEMYATIKETFDNLNSEEFAQLVQAKIFDNRTFTDVEYYGANFTVEEDHGTANMAVLAANGDAVVVTSTVNTYFGAKVRSRRTGIILNDVMDDFSTPGVVNVFGVPASPANYIRPGKIPMSSMCPAIILDQHGNVRLLVGAAGGTKITTSVATTIMKYLIMDESMDQAINDGRVHHQLAPMVVEVEAEVPTHLREYLQKVGHKLNVLPEGTGFAALTAIGVRDGTPEPYYDRRRVGSTATIQKKNKMAH